MNILKSAFLATAIFAAQASFAQFKQTPLPYAYTALEGTIDAQTMEIHYSKHAAAYTSNLNKAIAGTPAEKESLESILGISPNILQQYVIMVADTTITNCFGLS